MIPCCYLLSAEFQHQCAPPCPDYLSFPYKYNVDIFCDKLNEFEIQSILFLNKDFKIIMMATLFCHFATQCSKYNNEREEQS
jgi:hypothetical protein